MNDQPSMLPERPIHKNEMLLEIDRELIMRDRVYPKRVADRKMTQKTADRQIAVMRAIRALVERSEA